MKRLLLTLSLLTMINLETAHAIDVQGHRGARAVLPENSLPALEHALALGVDTLEFDTGVSKDGVVMVCLLYTSPSPRDLSTSRMPSSA